MNNRKPLDFRTWPEVELGTLIGVIVETWVSHSSEAFVVRLPLYRILRERMLIIFQGKRLLKDSDEHFVSRKATLAIEEKITETRVACFCQGACFADGRKGAVQIIRLKLFPRYPSEIADLPIGTSPVVY